MYVILVYVVGMSAPGVWINDNVSPFPAAGGAVGKQEERLNPGVNGEATVGGEALKVEGYVGSFKALLGAFDGVVDGQSIGRS